jgi:protein involved in polysaccharide export with SLBB domain
LAEGKIILLKQFIVVALISLGLFGSNPLKAQSYSADSASRTVAITPFDRPINPDLYVIRPGERLVVTPIKAGLAGAELVVGPEGKIIDTRIGVIDVAGMTLTQVRKCLEVPLAGQFRSSQIVVSVTAPRLISISITGAVHHPGSYLLYSSQRVSEAIARAGGLKPGASTRRIELSGGPATLIADLDRVNFGGNAGADLPLYAGTSLHVPLHSTQSVRVVGEVVSPREIELVEGDRRSDVVILAGGVLPTGDEKRCYLLNDSQRALSDIVPRNGDLLIVPVSEEYLNQRGVTVSGAVLRPGGYRFRDGMNLTELIYEVGGVSIDAVLGRTVIFRRHERMEPGSDTLPPTPISNLCDAGGKLKPIALRPLDSIYIPASVGVVKISGLVRRPGVFLYVKEQTINEYVGAAGGFASSIGRVDMSIRNHITGQIFLAASESIVEDGDEILITSAER